MSICIYVNYVLYYYIILSIMYFCIYVYYI